MSTRTIIEIDQEKCTGCGLCIPNCPEGALRVIDGKARLVSDLFCDGLGACVGHCPEGAITLSRREAQPYDERRVMEVIAAQGPNTIRAHLEHLDAHGEKGLLREGLELLKEKGITVPAWAPAGEAGSGGAVPARANWPIQLHLLSPMAPELRGKDVLLSADCVAHAAADFHARFLGAKVLAIACPKLDDRREIYEEKITALVDHAQANTITVAMMEVPCCAGLLAMARSALARAHRKVPLKAIVVSVDGGKVLSEEWV
jgi:ferredoxin